MATPYQYDTRGASHASQIINLERMIEERDAEIDRLRDQLSNVENSMLRRFDPSAAESTDLYTFIACLRAKNERLLGIIASIKAYCDRSKWRMRGRGAPTLQGQDMAYTHVLNYIDQLERNAAIAAKEE